MTPPSRAYGRADVAVMNHDGVRADLRAGQATYGSLFEVQPFGNVLYRLTVTGRDLRAYMERIVGRRSPNAYLSGLLVDYDTTRAPGARIRTLALRDGAPVADTGRYTLVLNDFELTGGSGLGFPGTPLDTKSLNQTDHEAKRA